MASFAPIRGTRAQLTPTVTPPVTPIVDGQFLIETDQGNESKIYTDIIENGTPKRIVVGGGGHDMIPVDDVSTTPPTYNYDMDVLSTLTDGDSHYVVNAYSVQRWSNCEVTTLKAHIDQGTDTVGLWEDNPTWKNYDPTTDDPTVYREGWLWDKKLYGVLSDPAIKDYIEITPVFDMDKSEVVSLYAMRIDDGVYLPVTPVGTEDPYKEEWFELSGSAFVRTADTSVQSGKTYYDGGGAVAFKLNSAIYTSTGVDIGVNLKYQHINVVDLTPIS